MFRRNQIRTVYMDVGDWEDLRCEYVMHPGHPETALTPREYPEAELYHVFDTEGNSVLSLLDDSEIETIEAYINEEGDQEAYDGY